MRGILTGWNAMRVLRLILGVIIVVQGINNGEALYWVLGGMLVLMALANAGCCGSIGCAVDTRSRKGKEEKEIVYEEVDTTK
jgi:hypothetical protein